MLLPVILFEDLLEVIKHLLIGVLRIDHALDAHHQEWINEIQIVVLFHFQFSLACSAQDSPPPTMANSAHSQSHRSAQGAFPFHCRDRCHSLARSWISSSTAATANSRLA